MEDHLDIHCIWNNENIPDDKFDQVLGASLVQNRSLIELKFL